MTSVETNKIAPSTLIVDSEIISRHVIADYLRHCGYSVVESANFDEAYTDVGEPSLLIDIVLLAVIGSETRMAFEFAQWLRSNQPELQVSLAGGIDMAAQTAADQQTPQPSNE
ncbi:response regulator [Sphingorhabdus sp.]|uniref:response regulator n=1 Tax=Sphingorhabdus sp. TaxID=1902408 RepID=UPI00391D2367